MIPAYVLQIIFYCFCLITAIQVFYYLFFFSRLAFYKPQAKNVSQTHPISVVICARDEAANLAKNLPGALVQQYRTTHEVIVVNDNSFDESKYILDEYRKTFKQLKVIELTQEARFIPGKKFPLSVGIKEAKHEVLLMTDADCVPASEFWIEKMQEGYHPDTEIVLGYGAFHKKKGFMNKIIRWETFHTALQYLSYAAAGLPYMGVGRNLSYKKSVFFRHKGFSSHNHVASGDDDLFINLAASKKNTRIVVDKAAFTLSEPARTWKEWTRQKSRHYTTSRYYKAGHKFLLGLYALSHGVFFPLFLAALIFYSWKLALIIFAVRTVVQALIFYKTMDKLDEKDLFPWFFVLDIWMFFYYVIFSFAMVKKPRKTWR
jgi:glycosyltransferase involved in cell wall biosynthesis